MYKNNPVEVSKESLKDEIRKAKGLTSGVIGVNIMAVSSIFGDVVKTAIEEKVDIIFCGAGLPLDLPKYAEDGYGTKLVPIISSARATLIILKKWISKYNRLPDAFVVEGPLAGGHLGFKKNRFFPVGLPGITIKNDFITAARKRIYHPFNCPYQCMKACDFKKVLIVSP